MIDWSPVAQQSARLPRLGREDLISQIILQLINAPRDLIKFHNICEIPTSTSSLLRAIRQGSHNESETNECFAH